tara:strand:+ start:589 stop:954 length:366 start_codon:yes stop_codon:yes gene_type:complete
MQSDNYSTPKWVMRLFPDWFDPCPLDPNFSEDGLKMDWRKWTFVNPPYSNVIPWVEKAISENKKGKTIVMLLNVDPSTKWYAKLVNANAHFLFFAERLKFSGIKSNPRPSMLVILGDEDAK